MEIVFTALVAVAGVLAATFATIWSLLRQAIEKRNHQLFDAYVHCPRELETWLVRGALEHIQHARSIEGSQR